MSLLDIPDDILGIIADYVHYEPRYKTGRRNDYALVSYKLKASHDWRERDNESTRSLIKVLGIRARHATLFHCGKNRPIPALPNLRHLRVFYDGHILPDTLTTLDLRNARSNKLMKLPPNLTRLVMRGDAITVDSWPESLTYLATTANYYPKLPVGLRVLKADGWNASPDVSHLVNLHTLQLRLTPTTNLPASITRIIVPHSSQSRTDVFDGLQLKCLTVWNWPDIVMQKSITCLKFKSHITKRDFTSALGTSVCDFRICCFLFTDFRNEFGDMLSKSNITSLTVYTAGSGKADYIPHYDTIWRRLAESKLVTINAGSIDSQHVLRNLPATIKRVRISRSREIMNTGAFRNLPAGLEELGIYVSFCDFSPKYMRDAVRLIIDDVLIDKRHEHIKVARFIDDQATRDYMADISKKPIKRQDMQQLWVEHDVGALLRRAAKDIPLAKQNALALPSGAAKDIPLAQAGIMSTPIYQTGYPIRVVDTAAKLNLAGLSIDHERT